MPKMKTDAIHKQFIYDEITGYSQCKRCRTKLKGHHATNLKNHMANKHFDEFNETLIINKFVEKNKPVNQKKKNDVIDIIKMNCLKLVTIHGRPVEMVEDESFQRIIAMITSGQRDASPINVHAIQSMIADKAHHIRLKMANEIQNRLICLKLDCAAYKSRAFLGINAQFVNNDTITIRTLATEELHDKQNSNYLKKLIFDTLNYHKIDISQIYSITTDNGQNFKKLTNSSNGLFTSDVDANIEQHIDSGTDESDEDEDSSVIYVSPETNIENLLDTIIEDEIFSAYKPRTMQCLAQILQLTVTNMLQSTIEIQYLLQNAREAVKAMHTLKFVKILRKANLRKPVVDCSTIWTSTYKMLIRLRAVKYVCVQHTEILAILNESAWQTIDDLIDCMKPLYETTLKLQREQLTIGDFFLEWLTCKGQLEQFRSQISQSMLESMKTTETNLLNNNLMLEALYLDTRLNVILSEYEATKAQQLLLETLSQLQKVKKDSDSFIVKTEPDEPTFEIEASTSSHPIANTSRMSFAELILSRTERLRGKERQENKSTDILLQEVRKLPRLSSDENILKFWANKTISSELSELALSVLATPATQVSMERLFSSIEYIVSPSATNLSRKILANIIVIRSNPDLLD